jgi:hypothetical protein
VENISYWDLFPQEFADAAFCGESTPEYMLIGEPGLTKMRDIIGNAHVILLCRNPIERLISAFKLLVHYNQIQLDKEGLDNFFLELIMQERPWFKHQLKYGDYVGAMRRYQKFFKEVCMIYYDDFFGKESAILQQLSDFLGLKFDQPQFNSTFQQRINDLKLNYEPSGQVRELLTEKLTSYVDTLNEYAGRELMK